MDLLTAFTDHLSLGLSEALAPMNLWYCFLGVFLGTLVGVLPGLGALITISLLLPFTYQLPVEGALIMLAGVYFGADFGGGTCSILLGVPGHPAAAVDVLDGYPMAKKGRGGVALFIKSVASAWGSIFGILLLMLFAPLLARFARQFSPVEYTALMALGLVAAATVGRGSMLKGLATMVIGLIIATVGTDVNTGFQRFTFGLTGLSDGISLIALAMGLFAVTEVITSAGQKSVSPVKASYATSCRRVGNGAASGRRCCAGRGWGRFSARCRAPAVAWPPSCPMPWRRSFPGTLSNSAMARSRALPRPRPATMRASARR